MAYQIKRYIRPYAEAKENMLDRSRRGTFEYTEHEAVTGVFDKLTSLDKDAWAAAFSEVAEPYELRAEEAEAKGDKKAAEENYLKAYAYYRLGRYPATNSPGKKAAYQRSVDCYLKAARYFDPPLEKLDIPLKGGSAGIIGYYRRPKTAGRVPLLVAWGGIDGYKEDRRAGPFLDRGIAVLALDNAGVGQAPVKAMQDGDRYFDSILEYAAARDDVNPARIAVMGSSTGGYWAAKLAHTRRELIRCSVNHGGCAHYTFQPDWIEQAQNGEYAFELAEGLAYSFLGDDAGFDDWVREAPKLSLLDQGVLDQPCCSLLSVNGTKDTIFTIRDMYLLFEHGDPKWGFFLPVGHMGHTPRTQQVIVDWISGQLEVGS